MNIIRGGFQHIIPGNYDSGQKLCVHFCGQILRQELINSPWNVRPDEIQQFKSSFNTVNTIGLQNSSMFLRNFTPVVYKRPVLGHA